MESLPQIKAELIKVGIPDAEANAAAPCIARQLDAGETLSPEAEAQAHTMGITPIPFSNTVMHEYSNWVQRFKAPAGSASDGGG